MVARILPWKHNSVSTSVAMYSLHINYNDNNIYHKYFLLSHPFPSCGY